MTRFYQCRRPRRAILRLVLAFALVAGTAISAPRRVPLLSSWGQNPSEAKTARGVEIVNHAGYPELRVDGFPFFIHSAAFFYYRIPADQWERLLRIYRLAGINTIDLYIPWNWHELKEGELDFDGHTNPRRNLRALLALIAREDLKLIARPGPEILNEWRHGGYPGWLLQRPEYKMSPLDWIEGRYPPLDNLNATDAEAAAQGWLANSTHMAQSRDWLTAVSKELAPFSSHRSAAAQGGSEDSKETPPHNVSGPLLFVQLGDDFALGRSNQVGPDFWRYLESLRGAIDAGGLDVPVFINPTDMRVSAAGSSLAKPVGVMGQWYMPVRAADEDGERTVKASDAAEIEFFAEELKTQPAFPPVMIEYQAGWYTPGEDDRPIESPPQNTLLSSRLLIANGIHGINYFPLQDTYSPAGYSVPWANRSYRWDAALAPDGEPQPRLRAVTRNTQILQRWGPQLAASHKRADFGLVYPIGSYPQDQLARADITLVSGTIMRIERLGSLAMLSSELLDPEYQPAAQFLRHPLVLLPVLDPEMPQFQLSEKAQRTMVEYVRRGGTLLVFPARPRGAVFDELWKDAPPATSAQLDSAIRSRWKFGDGEVIQSSKDFYSWVAADRALPDIAAQREADWAVGVLREFLAAAGIRPSVRVSGKTNNMLATQVVSNEGTDPLGARKSGRGFLSVTNLDPEFPADRLLEVLPSSASSRGPQMDYLPLHVIVPPHDSLLLPLDASICFSDPANAPCGESVTAASAEFLDAHRDGKNLQLLFYVPSRAEIHLHLPLQPSHVLLDENRMEFRWNAADHDLLLAIPRGAAPRFERVLTVDLATEPHVPEREKQGKPVFGDIDYFVSNSVRLPTGIDVAMRTYPPLLVADKNRSFSLVLQAENRTANPNVSVDLGVSGPLHGSGSLRVLPRGASIEKVSLKPSQNDLMGLAPAPDGFLRGTLELKMGRDRRTVPLVFLQPREDGLYHYRYDFDRDGADEWVLENPNLRLIVSPESGGRALALVDKLLGANLGTSVGLFRDNFAYTENPKGINELRARGRYGLFNRSYAAEWQADSKVPVLKLRYDAPDVYPAGARIEKSIQFEESTGLRVKYRVALNAGGKNQPSSSDHPQAFVAVNSFPAFSQPGRVTKFCWPARDSSSPAKTETSPSIEQHCEDFMQSGPPIVVPTGTRHVEVRSPGRATTALEWDCANECGRLTIEPKAFSALFRLEFPRLTAGGEPGSYTVYLLSLGPK